MPLKDPEKRREWHRKYMRERYQNNPEHRRKHLARVKTKYADKAQACSRCGGPDPQGHHEDYDQPDKITWLCRECHRLEHPGEC